MSEYSPNLHSGDCMVIKGRSYIFNHSNLKVKFSMEKLYEDYTLESTKIVDNLGRTK